MSTFTIPTPITSHPAQRQAQPPSRQQPRPVDSITEALAQALAAAHPFHDRHGAADLTALCHQLSLKIGAPQHQAGTTTVAVDAEGAATLHLPIFIAGRTYRWYLAVGIARYLLQYGLPQVQGPVQLRPETPCSTSVRDQRIEGELQLFAGAVLMPAAEFTRQWARDPHRVAEHFDVSPGHAQQRARALRLI